MRGALDLLKLTAEHKQSTVQTLLFELLSDLMGL